MTLMLVLGVLIITTEFRHGTASSTFLVSPRRWPVLVAKLGAGAAGRRARRPALRPRQRRPRAADLLAAAAASCPRPATSSRSTPASSSPSPCSAAFGLGVGAIVRNQVGAIIAAIAFFFVISGAARTAARLDRRILPGPGGRLPARAGRRRRQPDPGRGRPRPRRLVAGPGRDRDRWSAARRQQTRCCSE